MPILNYAHFIDERTETLEGLVKHGDGGAGIGPWEPGSEVSALCCFSVNYTTCFLPAGNTVFMAGTVALATKRVQRANCHIPSSGRQSSSSPFFLDSRGLKPLQEDTPQLMRTRSDVGVRRRGNVRTPSDQRRIRRHRFSINGHFYNHKVERMRDGGARGSPKGIRLLLGQLLRQSYRHVGSQVFAILSLGHGWASGSVRDERPQIRSPLRVVREVTSQTSELSPLLGKSTHYPLPMCISAAVWSHFL